MAGGLVLAGLLASAAARRIGWRTTRGLALAMLVLAVVGLATAPAIGVTLVASLALGAGSGTVLGHANATLAAPGGSRSRLQLARANVWAMVAAFVASVVLAVGVASGTGWWIGLAPALGLLAVIALDLRSDATAGPGVSVTASGRLPRGFWLTWAYLVAAVALEFSIVVWASTLVEQRTGVSTPEGTLIGALFLAGMFVGRVGLSLGLGARDDPRRPVGLGLLLAILGAVATWLSTIPALSAGALFVAGCGVAILYPLGVAIAIGASGGRFAVAGIRLTLASGLAILAAPLVLGAVSDATGVITGWALVPGLAVVALALVPSLPREVGPS
jgi:hypothetical protein